MRPKSAKHSSQLPLLGGLSTPGIMTPRVRGTATKRCLDEVKAMKLNGNAVKPGNVIEHNGRLWTAVKVANM